MPEVSIIITTHANRRDKLESAVNSVLNQTFQDWELIIVNDASTDDTADYISSLTDPRIKSHRFHTNTGKQSIAKNQGTSMSTGKYIGYLDSDNTFRPDHIQVLLNGFKHDPLADFVYGDRWFVDESGTVPAQIGVLSDWAPRLILLRNFIDASDFLIKREVLFAIGGWDESIKRMADWNLTCRLAKGGYQGLRMPIIITDYFLGADSISHKVDDMGTWNPFEIDVELPYLGHEVKDPKVAIFTITHDPNRLPILQKCFTELKKKAGYPYTHVVVLNGVIPDTKKWLEDEYKPDYIIELPENQGIAAASNAALDYLRDKDFDVIMKVDDDMLTLSDNLILEMVKLYRKNHMMVWSAYPEGLIDNAGGVPRLSYGTLGGHFIGIVPHVGGFCQFMPAKARLTCQFPSKAPLHWMDDLFISQWCGRHGYGMAYIEDLRVRHVLKLNLNES